MRLAGIRILQKGDPGTGFVPEIIWVAKDGSAGRVPVENVLRWVPTKSRWGNWLLFPVVPDQPAPEIVELNFKPSPVFQKLEIWAIEKN